MGAATLAAPFVAGPRNAFVKDFLQRSGFREVRLNHWELPMAVLPGLPQHLRWADPVQR
jgi:hypothetical protein